MKFTLSWLKEHLDTAADAATIGETLTAIGLEVDALTDKAAQLAPFTVAYVKHAEKHPNADKLRVCTVETGRGEVQVVCGAPNARAGIKVVFAAPGTVVPGTGLELKKGVIRGVESAGMLCSAREMGLGQDHDGIMELPADAPLGQPFAPVVGADDALFEIGLTPNRADCAGIRGIARDLAAAGLGRLKDLDAPAVDGAYDSPIKVHFDLHGEFAGACPLFIGRHFRGVKNGPSPKWLKDRLESIGLRSISTLVDITNLFTFDLARPLHVFDAGKVRGDLVVRPSKAGETFRGLDGKDYALDAGMTVICDESGVVSLGGVMGGEGTGVAEETTEVFLEVALFDPVRTAMTGRKTGIISDARYRFERGLDPAFALKALNLATRMILDLCGGEAARPVMTGSVPEWRRQIAFRPARVEGLGGVHVDFGRQEAILRALGFEVAKGGESWTVVPPSWRGDVEGEADLVEEVLRIHGLDNVPALPMPRLDAMTRPAVTPKQRATLLAKRLLAGRGMDEAVTWSFMSSRQAGLFGPVAPELRLANPISSDLDVMRPSLLANLASAAGRNAARGYPDAALFEVGPAYRHIRPDGQDLVAAGVRAGHTPRHWAAPQRPVDAYDAKADAVALLEGLGAPLDKLQTTTDAPDWYHPGRSGVLRLGANVLARFGELHPAVLEALDVKGPVVGFEVFLDALPQRKAKDPARPKLSLSAFQPVRRDFAFLVDAGIEAEKLVRAAKGADKALIGEVAVFDVYTGKGVDPGRKSVALQVTLQPTEKTLTDEEIEAVGARIVAAVAKATGGSLRG